MIMRRFSRSLTLTSGSARDQARANIRAVPRTLVTFHAHPDDEAIATGGVMARAAADGHRVVRHAG
jgi:LmbE family N-acetylglucosaminyl deacetylase